MVNVLPVFHIRDSKQGFFNRKCFYILLVPFVFLFIWVVVVNYDYSYTGLPSVSQMYHTFVPGKENNPSTIIFMETSGRGVVRDRHLISMESAAKWNPEKEIKVYLFTNTSVPPTRTMVELSKTYENLKFIYMDMGDYVQGTLLEKWYKEGSWRTSLSPAAHSSDGLRLLALWKEGGIYLDFDVVTIKNLQFPVNAVMPESDIYLSSGCMAFQKEHPFLESAMRTFSEEYNPDVYVVNGPPLIAKTYKKFCGGKENNCDIVLLPMVTATPLLWEHGNELFDENLGEVIMKKFVNSSAVHWWNDLFHSRTVSANSTSAFCILAKANAPIVYEQVIINGHF